MKVLHFLLRSCRSVLLDGPQRLARKLRLSPEQHQLLEKLRDHRRAHAQAERLLRLAKWLNSGHAPSILYDMYDRLGQNEDELEAYRKQAENEKRAALHLIHMCRESGIPGWRIPVPYR